MVGLMTLPRTLLTLLGCVTLCAISFAFTEAGMALRQVRKDEMQLAKQSSDLMRHGDEVAQQIDGSFGDPNHGINAQLTDISRTTRIVAGLSSNLERSTREWAKTENQLAQQALTDESSLNGVLTSLQETEDSSSDFIREQKLTLSTSETALSESATKMGSLSDSLQAQLTPLLSNAVLSSQNLAASTKDVQIVADKFRDDFVKPKNRAWAYLKAVLGLGSQAGQISVLGK